MKKFISTTPKGSLVSIEYVILTSFMGFYTKFGSSNGPGYDISCFDFLQYCVKVKNADLVVFKFLTHKKGSIFRIPGRYSILIYMRIYEIIIKPM